MCNASFFAEDTGVSADDTLSLSVHSWWLSLPPCLSFNKAPRHLINLFSRGIDLLLLAVFTDQSSSNYSNRPSCPELQCTLTIFSDKKNNQPKQPIYLLPAPHLTSFPVLIHFILPSFLYPLLAVHLPRLCILPV